ncbi:MAG TPA: hypothetical protein VKO63_01725, partial [Chitinispirillaceae bacterium]|nr:hypothetical protein [Chitinispirillaceae bacterium]
KKSNKDQLFTAYKLGYMEGASATTQIVNGELIMLFDPQIKAENRMQKYFDLAFFNDSIDFVDSTVYRILNNTVIANEAMNTKKDKLILYCP